MERLLRRRSREPRLPRRGPQCGDRKCRRQRARPSRRLARQALRGRQPDAGKPRPRQLLPRAVREHPAVRHERRRRLRDLPFGESRGGDARSGVRHHAAHAARLGPARSAQGLPARHRQRGHEAGLVVGADPAQVRGSQRQRQERSAARLLAQQQDRQVAGIRRVAHRRMHGVHRHRGLRRGSPGQRSRLPVRRRRDRRGGDLVSGARVPMSTIVESQGVRTRMRNSQPLAAALRVVVAGLIVALTASAGHARPAYFEQFKEFYSIPDGSNLDACGVCHFRWYGTGARNPFGSTVEQQLYLGKTVMQSLMDVEGMDPDGDGYTSGDEIITFMTLPGYNCANYTDAIDPPLGYDTYITPGVATCHEPLDIRVSPTSVGMILYNGQTRTSSVTVFNNGSDDPLNITSYALLPGAPASLSVSGPATPLSIPVGQSITLDITFSPATDTFS